MSGEGQMSSHVHGLYWRDECDCMRPLSVSDLSTVAYAASVAIAAAAAADTAISGIKVLALRCALRRKTDRHRASHACRANSLETCFKEIEVGLIAQEPIVAEFHYYYAHCVWDVSEMSYFAISNIFQRYISLAIKFVIRMEDTGAGIYQNRFVTLEGRNCNTFRTFLAQSPSTAYQEKTSVKDAGIFYKKRN